MKLSWDNNKQKLVIDMSNTILFSKNEFGLFFDTSLQEHGSIPFLLEGGYIYEVPSSKFKKFIHCTKTLWKWL